MRKITGVWEHTDKHGKTYYTGNIDGKTIIMFTNDRKSTDNQPDFNLYYADPPQQPSSAPLNPEPI